MAHHAHSGSNFASIFSRWAALLILGAGCAGISGCAETKETLYVDEVPLYTAPLASFTTALGYDVALTGVTLALDSQSFTRFGEAHQARLPLFDWAFSTAWAHPGHSQGGEVTGEASGPSEARFGENSAEPFSFAQLATGAYDAVDFVFGRRADDPETSIYLEGFWSKEGVDCEERTMSNPCFFQFYIKQDVGRRVIGVPFEANVTDDRPLVLHFDGRSRYEVGGVYPTVFDSVEFKDFQWEMGEEHSFMPVAPEIHNRIRNQLQKHDYYFYEQPQ